MPKAYREYKVSELKEMLSQRGIAVSGTKPELIARLEENDAATAAEPEQNEPEVQAEEPEVEAAPEAETVPEAEAAPEAETAPEAAPETETAPAAQPAASSDAIVPAAADPEADPTETAIKDLEKRIERMKRFGEAPEELVQQLNRIKRFGFVPPKPVSQNRGGSRSFRGRKRQGPRPVKVSKQ